MAEKLIPTNSMERRLLMDALYTRRVAMDKVDRKSEARRCRDLSAKIRDIADGR